MQRKGLFRRGVAVSLTVVLSLTLPVYIVGASPKGALRTPEALTAASTSAAGPVEEWKGGQRPVDRIDGAPAAQVADLAPPAPGDWAPPVSTPGQLEPPEQPPVPATDTWRAVLAMERLSTGNPKLSSSLDQLLEARRGEGRRQADAFAGNHGLRLDAGRVQVVIETTPGAIRGLRRAIA
ncbi:MAG: hypothetical protein PVG71_04345, partial [Anaerolineae bacterium]